MRFRLTLRSVPLDDLEIGSNFLEISRAFADLGGNNGSTNCQRQNCSLLNVLSTIYKLL